MVLNLDDKVIFVSGGTGSWGNELIKQILEKYLPKEIRIFSRGEIKQWEMKKKFNNHPKLKFIIGDVRDLEKLRISMKNVDYVFHLAALKHVPICEENPNETVLTNIVGTQNLITAALENNVERVVQVSTDKAVDPLNIYGITKSCAERLIIAANNNPSSNTKFVCVRGGNVLGTNGSIVPLLREQILTKGRITLTDERMTRFFLNLDEAISLIFKSIKNSFGGEIFVMKMPAMKIITLAEVMSDELAEGKTILIDKIGIRPGEKIHEVLVSRYDEGRVIDLGDSFVILPHSPINGLKEKYKHFPIKTNVEFSSDNAYILSKEEIKEMVSREGWLDKSKIPKDSFLEVKKEVNLPEGVKYV